MAADLDLAPEASFRRLKARARRLVWGSVVLLVVAILSALAAWAAGLWWLQTGAGALAGWTSAQLCEYLTTLRRLKGLV